ncbi:MAG: [Fe-Fe] hydrogenase large subunit C-terminal domain-containing protein [Bacteroidales bacterium]|jgi:iron only hydrogenase large subunit-like protein/nitrogen-specific signal transduction histidine kinase|nr:[Fe-Fe] hydrogenase large subunit C-terminal domain-containing protein [Bacteroidales bacterium]
MKNESSNKDRYLVYTLKNRCRVCYTCVRECPAKAIKIINGQAEVLNERCIVCGNCTKVCSQGAKVFLHTIDNVNEILRTSRKKIAIVAPSFPAEFEEINDHKVFVSMIRKLGFEVVSEVAFGADLVATRYHKLVKEGSDKGYISSDCPAIVSYIEHYHPNLVDNLAPIPSPMVAMARVMRKKYGEQTRIVFIGPCVAKKAESDEVDEMITFAELREMFSDRKITPFDLEPTEFDPPLGGKGAVFPISRGLLQTAGITDDVLHGNIIVAEGKNDFQEAIKEFEDGLIQSQHLELLGCEGCIMGPGMTNRQRHYAKRSLVNHYVKQKIENLDHEKWKKDIETYLEIDLTAQYKARERMLESPERKEVEEVLEAMGKQSLKDHLNCGACGYETCEEHAKAIVQGLAEIEMCLPYTIEKLHKSVNELAVTNEKLTTMQQALRQSEKMASMGQLSAGIAHELNNPLGVVIMYANILLEETPKDSQLHKDLKLIVDQTNRCKKIVGGLLNFARKNQVNVSEIDICRLAKQSTDAVIIPENIQVAIDDTKLNNPIASLDQEQMLQILSNLMKNAIDAMPEGGRLDIILEDTAREVIFYVKDSGCGINADDLDKIFEPFYTTKEIGKGTGLGLATAYGIVKMHKGKITVSSNADPNQGPTGTTFRIAIPRIQ